MQPITLKPERQVELAEYAKRHGQDPETALDALLADYFEWERQEHDETVHAVLQAYEDVKAGRTEPAEDFLEELREKHGFPR